MPVTLPLALALAAGLSLLAVGAVATGMGGSVGWDSWSMTGGDHGTMMADHETDHDHESMTVEECPEGAEAHQAHMEGSDHCEG